MEPEVGGSKPPSCTTRILTSEVESAAMMFRRELFRRLTGVLLLGSADLLLRRPDANARDLDVGGTVGAIVDHLVPAADLPR